MLTLPDPRSIGQHGPYALVVNTGSTPSGNLGTSSLPLTSPPYYSADWCRSFPLSDTSFFDGLGITGYYTAAQRGRVSGTASGISSSFAGLQTVGWSSAEQQYWARADSSGKFTSPLMIPGSYKQTLYKVRRPVPAPSVARR
jgi:rhamnogalacturonan endolyase